jgi:hypothetical protein
MGFILSPWSRDHDAAAADGAQYDDWPDARPVQLRNNILG